MREARASHSDDDFTDMLCCLVYVFDIGQDEVLDMPYLRSIVLMEWYADTMKSSGGPDEQRMMKGKVM